MEEPGIGERILLRWVIRKMDGGIRLDVSGSGWGLVAGTCEYGEEPSFLKKPKDAIIFPNLFLSRNSTCFQMMGRGTARNIYIFLTKINLEKLMRLLVLLTLWCRNFTFKF